MPSRPERPAGRGQSRPPPAGQGGQAGLSKRATLAVLAALPALGLAAYGAAARPAHAAGRSAPATAQAPPAGEPLSDVRVRAALEELRADPLMGGEQSHKQLRWRDKDSPDPKNRPAPWLQAVLAWIAGAGRALASGARWLLIVAIAIGVGLLGVLVWRSWQRRGPRRVQPIDAPTHVRGLDIRPEALPEDIAGLARRLWRQGEQRGALLLLYRALLSRLAHGWQVPVRDSSTEGDCLRLATGRLGDDALAFLGGFLKDWQAAAYASQWPDDPRFEALCAGFEAGGVVGR